MTAIQMEMMDAHQPAKFSMDGLAQLLTLLVFLLAEMDLSLFLRMKSVMIKTELVTMDVLPVWLITDILAQVKNLFVLTLAVMV